MPRCQTTFVRVLLIPSSTAARNRHTKSRLADAIRIFRLSTVFPLTRRVPDVPEKRRSPGGPEGRKTIATGESPWNSTGKGTKPRRGDRGSCGHAFCRPCGPAGLVHSIRHYPGLASGAIFCRPSGTYSFPNSRAHSRQAASARRWARRHDLRRKTIPRVRVRIIPIRFRFVARHPGLLRMKARNPAGSGRTSAPQVELRHPRRRRVPNFNSTR